MPFRSIGENCRFLDQEWILSGLSRHIDPIERNY